MTSVAGRRTSSSGCSPRSSRPAASGQGQVVDAAIVDGTAHLSAMFASMLAGGLAHERAGREPARRRRAFYDVYETADGKHLAVGALEPQFYAVLVDDLGLARRVPDRDDLAPVAGAARGVRATVQGAHPGGVDRGASTAPTPAWRRSCR